MGSTGDTGSGCDVGALRTLQGEGQGVAELQCWAGSWTGPCSIRRGIPWNDRIMASQNHLGMTESPWNALGWKRPSRPPFKDHPVLGGQGHLPPEQVPFQAQLHCSFPSAHSSFGCFGALPGAGGVSSATALPTGWTAPARLSAGNWDHRDSHPWMIWG